MCSMIFSGTWPAGDLFTAGLPDVGGFLLAPVAGGGMSGGSYRARRQVPPGGNSGLRVTAAGGTREVTPLPGL